MNSLDKMEDYARLKAENEALNLRVARLVEAINQWGWGNSKLLEALSATAQDDQTWLAEQKAIKLPDGWAEAGNLARNIANCGNMIEVTNTGLSLLASAIIAIDKMAEDLRSQSKGEEA